MSGGFWLKRGVGIEPHSFLISPEGFNVGDVAAPCVCCGVELCRCPPGEAGGIIWWGAEFQAAYPFDWLVTRDVTDHLSSFLPHTYGPFPWEPTPNLIEYDSSVAGDESADHAYELRAARICEWSTTWTGDDFYSGGRWPESDTLVILDSGVHGSTHTFTKDDPWSSYGSGHFQVNLQDGADPLLFFVEWTPPGVDSPSNICAYLARYNRETHIAAISWSAASWSTNLGRYRVVAGSENISVEYAPNTTYQPTFPAIPVQQLISGVWTDIGTCYRSSSMPSRGRVTAGTISETTDAVLTGSITPTAFAAGHYNVSPPWPSAWSATLLEASSLAVGPYPYGYQSTLAFNAYTYAAQTYPDKISDSMPLDVCFDDVDVNPMTVTGSGGMRDFDDALSNWSRYYEMMIPVTWDAAYADDYISLDGNHTPCSIPVTVAVFVHRYLYGVYQDSTDVTVELGDFSFNHDVSDPTKIFLTVQAGEVTGASGTYSFTASVNYSSEEIPVDGWGPTTPYDYWYEPPIASITVVNSAAATGETFECELTAAPAPISFSGGRKGPTLIPARMHAYSSGAEGAESIYDSITEVKLLRAYGDVWTPLGTAITDKWISISGSTYPAVLDFSESDTYSASFDLQVGESSIPSDPSTGSFVGRSDVMTMGQDFEAVEALGSEVLALPAKLKISYAGGSDSDYANSVFDLVPCAIDASCSTVPFCGQRIDDEEAAPDITGPTTSFQFVQYNAESHDASVTVVSDDVSDRIRTIVYNISFYPGGGDPDIDLGDFTVILGVGEYHISNHEFEPDYEGVPTTVKIAVLCVNADKQRLSRVYSGVRSWLGMNTDPVFEVFETTQLGPGEYSMHPGPGVSGGGESYDTLYAPSSVIILEAFAPFTESSETLGPVSSFCYLRIEPQSVGVHDFFDFIRYAAAKWFPAGTGHLPYGESIDIEWSGVYVGRTILGSMVIG